MARIGGGLKALFSAKQIEEAINEWGEQVEWQIEQALHYAGQEFMNKARLTGNYTDDTGNLRASIGYIILKDGKPVGEKFEKNKGKGSKGVEKAKSVTNELASKFPKGYMLLGVAGMEYAAAVEAKNYDVITGSAPTREMMKSVFDGIEFGNF